jgi:hypothetical protein
MRQPARVPLSSVKTIEPSGAVATLAIRSRASVAGRPSRGGLVPPPAIVSTRAVGQPDASR